MNIFITGDRVKISEPNSLRSLIDSPILKKEMLGGTATVVKWEFAQCYTVQLDMNGKFCILKENEMYKIS